MVLKKFLKSHELILLKPAEPLTNDILLKGCFLYVHVQDESATADSSGLDDSSQERFIGPLPRDGAAGCSGDYSSPSYSYSSILNKSETGVVLSPVEYVTSLLLYNRNCPLTSCFLPPPLL